MKALARKESTKPKAKNMLGNFDIDEDSELTVAEQLGAALKANAGRVIDLFRGWDTDGDGEVSRKEFHKAMPLLGFDASKKDIDDLFSSWDADGGGSLDFGELKKILTSATRSGSADAKKRAESQKIVEGQKGKGKPKAK